MAISKITSDAIDATGFNLDSNTLTVDATNNRVGISTNSPSAPLEVSRSDAGIIQYITNTGSAQAYTAYGNSDNPPWSQDFNTAGGLLVGIDSDETGVVYQGGNYALRFGTNATERMRIDSVGSIGTIGRAFGLISNGQQPTTTLANNAALNLTVTGTATAGGGILCIYEPASGENAVYHVGYNRGNLISNSNGSLFATGTTSGKNTIQVSGHQITFTNRTGASRGYVFNLFIAGGFGYNQ